MHIRFLAYGKGSGRSAARYLIGERDHAGKLRAGVEVLRGDPRLVGQVIDSLRRQNKYRSGLIAFHPQDRPTHQQIERLLKEFEMAMTPGIDSARLCWTAVRHDEKGGGCHIHVLAARTDLATGKDYNPSPPGWQKSFDPLRDAWNFENGWARPDDPARQRGVQPGRMAGLKDNPREVITEHLFNQVAGGHLVNRADVLAELAKFGTVTRAGDKYISVRLDGADKAIRLRGGVSFPVKHTVEK